MIKKFVVDRIENGIAVCIYESGESFKLETSLLPAGTKEQDWISLENGKYLIDDDLTAKKREENKNLYNMLRKKDK